MKQNIWYLAVFVFTLFSLGVLSSCGNGDKARLLADFREPPESTKPGVYWYWMNEHVSKEGITKDLEAMKRVGIGEAFIGNIYEGGVPGDVRTLNRQYL